MNQEKQAILKERAEKLAQVPTTQKIDKQVMRLVKFRIGADLYGIEEHYVREINAVKDLTELPSSPKYLMGIINLRGEIISVLDLSAVIGIDTDREKLKKVVILHSQNEQFGVAVEEILSIEAIPEAEIRPTLPTLSGSKKQFLKGIAGSNLAILDAHKMLTDDSLKIGS